jgi:hypothetical protein
MRVHLRAISVMLLLNFGLSASCGRNPDAGTVVQPHAGNDGLPSRPDNGSKSALHPSGYFSYQPPIVPITFAISTDGQFSIDVNATIVTPLGVIRFGGNIAESSVDNKPLPDQSAGVTQLIICDQGSVRQNCKGYEIGTGRKLSIAMNGQFRQTVERNRITIDAWPGSTVTVSDAGPPAKTGARPAARIDVEEFDFSANSPDTEVDLERSQSGVTKDIAYDHMTGELKPINGAAISRIKQYAGVHHGMAIGNGMPKMDLPAENDCAQTKPSEWKSSFSEDNLKADIILACIQTAEGGFGYLVIGRDKAAKPVAYYVYAYTWVR